VFATDEHYGILYGQRSYKTAAKRARSLNTKIALSARVDELVGARDGQAVFPERNRYWEKSINVRWVLSRRNVYLTFTSDRAKTNCRRGLSRNPACRTVPNPRSKIRCTESAAPRIFSRGGKGSPRLICTWYDAFEVLIVDDKLVVTSVIGTQTILFVCVFL